MGVLAFITGILVWLSVDKLDKEEDKLNQLDAGRMVDPNKKD
jgi:POT family proton-dependent oligopeptide transporter